MQTVLVSRGREGRTNTTEGEGDVTKGLSQQWKVDYVRRCHGGCHLAGHGGAQRAAGWLRSCTEASGEHYDDARSATIPNLQLRHDYSTAVPTVPL
ncbi:hypothetical protein E2C01_022477 [Portunus trituberculatus]|uniref:Uncharacterized protein n=1 Tax=Portunus trituberculatus TaxID=210409 RepID=A0A5B7E7U1_PORTR|nr:hypothetical protein [Portunus trituberculatus]